MTSNPSLLSPAIDVIAVATRGARAVSPRSRKFRSAFVVRISAALLLPYSTSRFKFDIAGRAGYARQDKAVFLLIEAQAGPLDPVADAACVKLADASAACAVAARTRQPHAVEQRGFEQAQRCVRRKLHVAGQQSRREFPVVVGDVGE